MEQKSHYAERRDVQTKASVGECAEGMGRIVT